MKKVIYLLMSLSFVAFASCSGSGSQSAVSVFKSGTEDGHDYVDLGLTSGTKWATCNIGADNPQDYGNYYAWGEVTTKENYNWSTYLDGNISSRSDYGTDKDALKGVTDIAGTQYDAAAANWGGKWRMPTKAQQDELRNQCYWVWTDNYNNSNVEGYIVYKAKNSDDKGKKISKKNGTPSSSYSLSDAHIFLPAAGHRIGGDLHFAGHHGYCWSSSLDTDMPSNAWMVDFISNGYVNFDSDDRSWGLSVRAVCGSGNADSDNTSASTTGTENGHDYVDLGLTSGTKWATTNVGASKAEDYGNYYAWGEVTTKENYNWSTYKYGYGMMLTKYNTDSRYGENGFADGKTTLEPEDDAAHFNWGGKWRMPTQAQRDELRKECYWVWTENYDGSGVPGYIVYKAKNSDDKGRYDSTPSAYYSLSDAHIFLPAAGDGGSGYSTGRNNGNYISSTLYEEASLAYGMYTGSDYLTLTHIFRCDGSSVRAVIPGERK